MSEERIYGPYYFETSVNQHNYLSILKFFMISIVRSRSTKTSIFNKMEPYMAYGKCGPDLVDR